MGDFIDLKNFWTARGVLPLEMFPKGLRTPKFEATVQAGEVPWESGSCMDLVEVRVKVSVVVGPRLLRSEVSGAVFAY